MATIIVKVKTDVSDFNEPLLEKIHVAPEKMLKMHSTVTQEKPEWCCVHINDPVLQEGANPFRRAPYDEGTVKMRAVREGVHCLQDGTPDSVKPCILEVETPDDSVGAV